MNVVVELAGLQVPGRHGVEEWERQSVQPFSYDIWLELPEPAADRVEETADYRAVVELVREVSESRRFQLLEALAAAVAEALMERFPLERTRVRVRKPQVRLDAPVGYSAATVERARG